MGFEVLKEFYENDPFFGNIWQKYEHRIHEKFTTHDGFLFKSNRLCVPQCTFRESIIHEAHSVSLGGHFGRDKTSALMQEKKFWPKLEKDVRKYVERCNICHIAKSHKTKYWFVYSTTGCC